MNYRAFLFTACQDLRLPSAYESACWFGASVLFHLYTKNIAATNGAGHKRSEPSRAMLDRRKFLARRIGFAATAPLLMWQTIGSIEQKEFFMEIKRVGSQASTKGPADWFTGTVRIDPLFQANAPARAAGASVTFEAGARTAWHTHPLGQTLIVMAGAGLVQREGGPIEAIHPGDVVWFPPGLKHWHGATPTTAMTHIAIQEALDGKVVDWMEKVTDEQYGA